MGGEVIGGDGAIKHASNDPAASSRRSKKIYIAVKTLNGPEVRVERR